MFRILKKFSQKQSILCKPFSSENWYSKLPKHKMILKSQAHRMLHPIYSLQDIEVVELTHYDPKNFSDKFAYFLIKIFRKMFDVASRYDQNNMNESKFLFRFILLETVAGLPGSLDLIHFLIIIF